MVDGDEMEVRQVDDVWKVRGCCAFLAAEEEEEGEEEEAAVAVAVAVVVVAVVGGDLAGVRTCVWRRVFTTSV